MTNPKRQAQNQRSPKARSRQLGRPSPAPAQPRRSPSPQPAPAASPIGVDGVLKHKPGLVPVVPIKWAKETPKTPPPAAPQPAATSGQQAITVSLPVKVAAELDDLTRRFGVDRAETVTVALRSLQRVLDRAQHLQTMKANSRQGLYPWPGDVTHLPGNSDLIMAVDLACAIIDLLGAKAYPTTGVDTGDGAYAASCGAGVLLA